jgi:hypothetical protein
VRIENINAKYIERYISMKQEAGVSLRTTQNQMAHIRRFTNLTTVFSKKLENHMHIISPWRL